MISVNSAVEIILKNCENFGSEQIDFRDSLNRILKEDIIADRDFPPFDRVSMDGIAILAESFRNGRRSYQIEGVQAAGSKQISLQNPENCIESMTGAVLPNRTDVVIPYEMLEIKDGIANVICEEIRDFQNIHKKGLDRTQGDVIISNNTLISAAEIGALATVGASTVKVAKHPKVIIVSTGNELVEVEDTPEDFQIRRSNVYTVISLLERIKIKADSAHISDNKKILKEKIESYLKEYDVLIFSGAVSKGKFDFVPNVLSDLGVKKLFHKVKQRPGKPFWFGKKDKKTVFAFPGNPVSTFVSCIKYFYPWFHKSIGSELTKPHYAVLTEDFSFKPNLTCFLQVKIINDGGKLFAIPIQGKGSGDLANLVDADAFLEFPEDKVNFSRGEVFSYLEYRI